MAVCTVDWEVRERHFSLTDRADNEFRLSHFLYTPHTNYNAYKYKAFAKKSAHMHKNVHIV